MALGGVARTGVDDQLQRACAPASAGSGFCGLYSIALADVSRRFFRSPPGCQWRDPARVDRVGWGGLRGMGAGMARTMLRSSLPGGVVSPRRRPGDGACAETDRSRHHYTHGLDAQGLFHGTTQEAAYAAGRAASPILAVSRCRRGGGMKVTMLPSLPSEIPTAASRPRAGVRWDPSSLALLECLTVANLLCFDRGGFWKSPRCQHAASI